MKWFLLILCVFLNACSSLPAGIRHAPEMDIQYHNVITDIQDFQGLPVRWGGTIIDVENEQGASSAQVLYYPLNRNARPELNQQAQGRFVMQSSKLLDPAIYVKGTSVTIAGTLQGTMEKQIGKKSISLPVINIVDSYVWPPREKRYVYRSYGYSPNYYGYYGYRSRGYRYPYRYYACY